MTQTALPFDRGPRTRAEQVFRRFARFHLANPHVYACWAGHADAMREAGRDFYSANAITRRVRWDMDLETDTDEGVKINDAYSPLYARLYMIDRGAAGFFRTRHRRTEDRPPHAVDLAVFNSGPTGPEEGWLIRDLGRLLRGEDLGLEDD